MSKNMKLTISVIVGTFLFCFGLNVFVTPYGLYAGGVVGLSQIIRTLLDNAGLGFEFEISGYINMMFNIPLMFLAYKSISKRFFMLTSVSLVSQSLFFMIIPIPSAPIISEMLTSIIVGATICGFGIGHVLRSSASAGGTDIVSFYCISKFHNFSVGKLTIGINAVLFAICMILFDAEVAIYSIINTVIFSFVVDKIHYQNISMTAMIFTKKPEIRHAILHELRRGVTYWQGHGAYTDEGTYILVTAVSKYEVNTLRSMVKAVDENAFIIFSEGLSISGNFEKHL